MRRLVLPQYVFYADFRAAEMEYRREGRRQLTTIDIIGLPAQTVLAYYADLREGRNLAANLVASHAYWLIDGDRFVGSVSIRHELHGSLEQYGGHIGYMIRPSCRHLGYGTQILKLALPKARDLGIALALVTCDATNIASRRIIEANGGIFESAIDQGAGLPPKRRYWIETGA